MISIPEAISVPQTPNPPIGVLLPASFRPFSLPVLAATISEAQYYCRILQNFTNRMNIILLVREFIYKNQLGTGRLGFKCTVMEERYAGNCMSQRVLKLALKRALVHSLRPELLVA